MSPTEVLVFSVYVKIRIWLCVMLNAIVSEHFYKNISFRTVLTLSSLLCRWPTEEYPPFCEVRRTAVDWLNWGYQRLCLLWSDAYTYRNNNVERLKHRTQESIETGYSRKHLVYICLAFRWVHWHQPSHRSFLFFDPKCDCWIWYSLDSNTGNQEAQITLIDTALPIHLHTSSRFRMRPLLKE